MAKQQIRIDSIPGAQNIFHTPIRNEDLFNAGAFGIVGVRKNVTVTGKGGTRVCVVFDVYVYSTKETRACFLTSNPSRDALADYLLAQPGEYEVPCELYKQDLKDGRSFWHIVDEGTADEFTARLAAAQPEVTVDFDVE
jgi:hypothetical protein